MADKPISFTLWYATALAVMSAVLCLIGVVGHAITR